MEYAPRCIYLSNAWSLARYNFYNEKKEQVLRLTLIGEAHGMQRYIYGRRKIISISDFSIRLLDQTEAAGYDGKILLEIDQSLTAHESKHSNLESIPIIEILQKVPKEKLIGYNDRVKYIDEPELYYNNNTYNLHERFVEPFMAHKNELMCFNPDDYHQGSHKYIIELREKILKFFEKLTDKSLIDDVRKAWAMVADLDALRVLFKIREKPTHYILIAGFAHSENIHGLITEYQGKMSPMSRRSMGGLISGATRSKKYPMFYPDTDILKLDSGLHTFNINLGDD